MRNTMEREKETAKTKQSGSAAEAVLLGGAVVLVFAVLAAVLAVPVTREGFKSLSAAHPYAMGFAKFALLATAGELLAGRLAKGRFERPPYLGVRFLIWGVIGMWITYMKKIFFLGSGAMMTAGLLPAGKQEGLSRLEHAFYTSATMNLTFGPTFMAVHKVSDTYLQLRFESRGIGKRVTLNRVIETVDWHRFVSFTLGKTVPLFWIPAHTVTFLLPEAYQVVLAALLSVVLGVLLNWRSRKA